MSQRLQSLHLSQGMSSSLLPGKAGAPAEHILLPPELSTGPEPAESRAGTLQMAPAVIPGTDGGHGKRILWDGSKGVAPVLWEVKQELVVVWGNLQSSESQRNPCHHCHRAILSCPRAGLHFILCPLGVWIPAALGLPWVAHRKAFMPRGTL